MPHQCVIAALMLLTAVVTPSARQSHTPQPHHLIHTYDYPALAAKGLEAAVRYARIAEAAPHAQHMPSHIFTRVGRWNDSIASDSAAAQLARDRKEPDDQLHPMDYMAYAYLQLARDREARELADEMQTITGYTPERGAARAPNELGDTAKANEYSAGLQAQPATPPEPDPGTWIGSAGAGLALTSGNSDTLTFNLTFDATRDPKTRNVMKWTGLYLRGKQNDELVSNHLTLSFRDQYELSTRAYVYGQVEYLRDTFKLIDHLVAPTLGAGYKVIDTTTTKWSTDGGLGVAWEKNPDLEVRTSMALTAGEKLEHQLTTTTTLKHAATGLWKADDLADGLYSFAVGLATKMTDQLQLSIEVIDTFKNRPPTPATKKNDVTVVTAITAKF